MSGYLLDTCTFLWLIEDSKVLSKTARSAFLDRANPIYLSVASAWEIIVKVKRNNLNFPKPVHDYIIEQRKMLELESLPIDENSIYPLSRLPDIHADPFDRILVSQAMAHGLTIITPDEQISRYPVKTLW